VAGTAVGSGARFLAAFAGAPLARAAPIIVREDGTLDLIGQFGNQGRRIPLELVGLSEQFPELQNARVFHV
jgi:hypothetical protein